MNPHNIKRIFSEIGEGNEGSFYEAYKFYKERFYSVALKMTHSAYRAEEIVQETFTRLWEKRALVARAADPENYFFTILYNIIFRHFRDVIRMDKLKANLPEVTVINDIEHQLYRKENRKILENIISRMPEAQQEVFRLIKLDGLERKEAASKLGISPNTVRNQLHSAISFLRKNLAGTIKLLILALVFQK